MYTMRVYVTHFPAGAGAVDGGQVPLRVCTSICTHTDTLIYCESVCHALPCRCRRSRWGGGYLSECAQLHDDPDRVLCYDSNQLHNVRVVKLTHRYWGETGVHRHCFEDLSVS